MRGTINNENTPMITVKLPNGIKKPSFSIHWLTKKVHAKGMMPRRMHTMTKQSLASWE